MKDLEPRSENNRSYVLKLFLVEHGENLGEEKSGKKGLVSYKTRV